MDSPSGESVHQVMDEAARLHVAQIAVRARILWLPGVAQELTGPGTFE